MQGTTSKVFDTWFSNFRSAAKVWSELIPKLSSVSSTGRPTYYARPSSTGQVCAGSPDSQLATAAAKLAKVCREFSHEPGDLLPIALAGLESALDDLAAMLDADADPATEEQTNAAREVDGLVLQNLAFKHRIANEGLTEMELRRLEMKSRQMEKGGDLRETYSLWQQTTDLMTRPNLHESSRVEELFYLRAIVSRLAQAAQERGMPRTELQSLGGRLRMLTPREWFHDPETRKQVLDEICRANVEVEELVRATGETAPAAVTTSLAIDNEHHGDSLSAMADSASLEFTAVERAITLLLRHGGQRKSVREYARLVGVSHTTLLRSEQWRKAWNASESTPTELPMGTKDGEGKLEAWKEEEVCENCRLEPITETAIVNGEVVRVCEGCARKLAQRTKPRTT